MRRDSGSIDGFITGSVDKRSADAKRCQPGRCVRVCGGALIFLLRDLSTQNLELWRRFDADAHSAAIAGYDDDANAAFNQDRVADATSKNEHVAYLSCSSV